MSNLAKPIITNEIIPEMYKFLKLFVIFMQWSNVAVTDRLNKTTLLHNSLNVFVQIQLRHNAAETTKSIK